MAETDKNTVTPDPQKADSIEAEAPRRPKADRYLIAFYTVLCIISVIELYSASSSVVSSNNIFGPIISHGFTLFLGIIICIGVSRVKLKYIVALTPWFVVISVILMIYVLINGDVINGARRSFPLATIQVQPAELLKMSAVLVIAFVMSRNQEQRGVKTRAVVICAASVILFSALLFTQGLTNTILLMGISLSMMLVGGVQWKKFGVVLLIYGLLGGGVLYIKLSNVEAVDKTVLTTGKDAQGNKTTIDRSSTWDGRLNRWNDTVPLYEQPINSLNRQEMFAHMAQAHGGITGVMPGNSRETARLPLAFTDFIYSIVVEDLGLIGGLFLLFVYLSLLGRAGVIAARCDRAFPSLLVTGMAVMVVFQALFHMAINTGVFPVSGQPLPMISKGGTSILITSLAFGIMLSISRYASMVGRKNASKTPNSDPTDDLPDEMSALNPSQLKK